tara:strand:+ start:282 stop:467 length:186 start_codon:yes stop_codon:yes gene_type:complete
LFLFNKGKRYSHANKRRNSRQERVLKKPKTPEEEKADFYRRGFWLCFVYVLYDTLHAFGWI